MRYEILVRCVFKIFVALRLFANCIFSAMKVSPGPYYKWNLNDILFLHHYDIPLKVNLGLTSSGVYLR